MPNQPQSILYYGHPDPPPFSYSLQAGPLTLRFETGDGFIRHIRYKNVEILRGVYAAVRDHNWNTVLPQLSKINVHQFDDGIRILFEVNCHKENIHFEWSGLIEGFSDGRLNYVFEGEAKSTFQRNRIGFCILHPMQNAGLPCQIEHTNGTITDSHFPDTISPHQPFFDIQTITHKAAQGIEVSVRMEGDIFEMEDQRNWTDASYKTYCTPLAEPFPVTVNTGTKITQKLQIKVEDTSQPSKQISIPNSFITFTVDHSQTNPLPKIGLGRAFHEEPLSALEIKRIRKIQIDHIRVDVHLWDDQAEQQFSQTIEEAIAVGTKLELALFLSTNANEELKQVVEWINANQNHISSILIYHRDEKTTTKQTIETALSILKPHCKQILIGSGTNFYFTELNRKRPPFDKLDFCSYSINPQVHAFDNLSLTETLSAQSVTVESAKHISQKPVHVSPVTFAPRFNPNATGPEPEPHPGELPSQVDRRQMSLFGAGWTVGSLKYLSQCGTQSITYYETTGWRGIMEKDSGSDIPSQFFSKPCTVFPMYHIFHALSALRQGNVINSVSDQPLEVDGMVLQSKNHMRMILTNFTNFCQHVLVKWDPCPKQLIIRHLNEFTVEEASTNPESFWQSKGIEQMTDAKNFEISLLPYATAFIDGNVS